MQVTTTGREDPMDSPRSRPAGEPGVVAGALGVRTAAGTHDLWTAAAEVQGGAEAIRTAILAADAAALMLMDREIVPFYCRECADSYCQAHWTTWEVFDPDWPAWFEELRGRCPEGHERRIYD
jgi:hypothetical protein